MSLFHSTAIIDGSSNIHSNAEIGPFCIIGPNVKIEENVKLLSNVVVPVSYTQLTLPTKRIV